MFDFLFSTLHFALHVLVFSNQIFYMFVTCLKKVKKTYELGDQFKPLKFRHSYISQTRFSYKQFLYTNDL